jgi:hypothetical protein
VDSYTTMAPFFMYLPTVVEAPTSGEKSGMCAASTGVGTATTMKSARLNWDGSVVTSSRVAAFSSSVETSPVGSQ